MTKYIVKNCPCLEEHTQNCWDSHIPNEISCKDRTDCPIKQVVELCKKISNHAEWCNCPDYPEAPLANKILQILQVEEVE